MKLYTAVLLLLTYHGLFECPLLNADEIPSGDAERMQRLMRIWKAQAEEVTSARIRGRKMVLGNDGVKKLSVKEIADIFVVSDDEVTPDLVDVLARKIALRVPADKSPTVPFSLLYDNEKYKEDLMPGYTVAMTGDTIAFSQPRNNQVSLYASERQPIATLSIQDLRYIPIPAEGVSYSFEDALGSGLAVLELETPGSGFRTRILYDDKSAFVKRLTTIIDGIVREDEFQLGRVISTDDIAFPMIRAKFGYGDQGRLLRANVYSIDELEINIPIADKEFALSAPEGTNIFDRRNGDGFVHKKIVLSTDDVVAEVDRLNSPEPRSTSTLFAIAVGAAIILALIAFFIGRQSHS